MATALEVTGLRKSYGNVHALKGVDLRVETGEVFGFLGPNGAGKTTFTKCVTGFVRPDGGSVRIMGEDALAAPHKVARHIGLVPDEYGYYAHLTGRQHLDLYGRLSGVPKAERARRIDDVLELVKMTGRADERVRGYSHGMKQRICIGQALLHRPGLIILDEPTNGLDPMGAFELRQIIKGLAHDGTTVFLNSHQLHEVEQTCERVAILAHGELKAVAPVRDLRGNAKGRRVKVRIERPLRTHHAALTEAGAKHIRLEGNEASFELDEPRVPDAVEALVRAGARLQRVDVEEASLESVFLSLVGGETA